MQIWKSVVGALALLAACYGPDKAAPPDARLDAGRDAFVPIVDGDDGTPVRESCTDHLGTAISETFGRLDGTLVAIVQPGARDCNGDDNHVHLQVRALGAVYDIAVNVGDEDGSADVHTTTIELALPAWVEGWHEGVLDDYVTDGVHSTDVPLAAPAAITADLNADLASVNHITIFATGYGPDGAHLVHREGGGHDGLVVTQPLSSPSHARLFSFSDQAY